MKTALDKILINIIRCLIALITLDTAAYFFLGRAVLQPGPIAAKLGGIAPDCPWRRIFSFHRDAARFRELQKDVLGKLQVVDQDQELDAELISSPSRAYWIRRPGVVMSGRTLLAYVLAEHDWMAENNPANMVREGDYVLDCGAHVGAFTHQALRLGAQTVVAIEPDPVNRECLRRNFRDEIASGRVIVVPKGVWSSNGELAMSLGVQNSGTSSLVHQEGGGTIQVTLTTIDDIVRDFGIPRVDYIKMDIEGAEREALAGAMATLRRFRPRLLLESYHRPDDMVVLPRLIRQAHADYGTVCGPCELHPGALVPHVVFYE